VFNPGFDPYDAIMQMNNNILQLDQNLKNLILAHNGLAEKVAQQEQVIDTLIEGLNNSNKANELLMREMASTVMDKLKEVK
jgi:hypothetical protein